MCVLCRVMKNETFRMFSTRESIDMNVLKSLIEKSLLCENTMSCYNIIQSIQEEYYHESSLFDAGRFELFKVAGYNSKDIIMHYKHLITQHHVLSKRVLILILQKHTECREEFRKILQIQKDLDYAVKISKLCRSNLDLATKNFTFSSLQILYYFKKRKLLESILNILYSIKNFCHMRDRLQHFLNDENYPKVIALISECQRKASSFKKYFCIAAFKNKLNDTLEQIEENLDSSLSKICKHFDVQKYASIQDAYIFLGKSQSAIDQLHMHFTAAVHNTALNCVRKYAVGDKKQYNQMCQSISLTNFINCFMDLFKSLLPILKSYFLIKKWHQDLSNTNTPDDREKLLTNNQYLLEKLENGLKKICIDIESKVIIYLQGFDLTFLKFEECMQALSILSRISKIEEQVCKTLKSMLHEKTKEKFINYLNIYHLSRLEELKIFLENESWKLCPLKPTFQMTQLQEYKTFEYIVNNSYENNFHNNICKICKDTQDSSGCIDNLTFLFDIISDETSDEDILQNAENSLKDFSDDSGDDEIPEELKHDYVEELQHKVILKTKKEYFGPLTTNTSLSLLRICGKYLQATCFFEDCNKNILFYITQIFDLYFYAVYTFFSCETNIGDADLLQGTNIKRTISRIRDSLDIEKNEFSKTCNFNINVQSPQFTCIVDFDDPHKLFGLAERIVAAESLVFLAKQYEALRSYLEDIKSNNEAKSFLNHFYNQTVSASVVLRKPIYMAPIAKYFDSVNILTQMNKINWDIKDIASQHNTYVDILIEDIQKFKIKLVAVHKVVPLSQEVHESIWENVAQFVSYIFVEGFSGAKKCSNCGRALMQLDYTQFVSKFESITSLRPVPYQDYVTSYIKAYYLTESTLESWIKVHSEYSSKHITGLVSTMYQSKKIKQKSMALMDDQRVHR